MALVELVLGIVELVLPSQDKRTRRYERLGWLLGLAVVAIGVVALVIGHGLGFGP